MRKKFYIQLVSIFAVITSLCFAQNPWDNQNSGTNKFLTDVHFVDQNNGWISGWTGTILHTTDGGANWNPQDPPPNNAYQSVYFVDDLNGWACGYAGKMIHTTDGGNTWTDQQSGTDNYLFDLHFLNADTGWAAGGDFGSFPLFEPTRLIIYTTNGGANWITQLDQDNKSVLLSIHFADKDNGCAVGETGAIVNTANGGKAWTEQMSTTSYHFRDVYFANNNTGWVVGNYLGLPHVSVIFNTVDGGINWDSQTFEEDESLAGIYFVDELTGWAVGGATTFGRVKHTTDGGINWVNQDSGTNNLLTRVFFLDSNSGWAVGYNGTIIATENPVSVIEDLAQPVEYELLQNYPNPFNPATTIKYSIPVRGFVTLRVFNTIGEEVRTLVNEFKEAGVYEVNFEAGDLSSGIYYYKLNSGNFNTIKKMILLK